MQGPPLKARLKPRWSRGAVIDKQTLSLQAKMSAIFAAY